MKLRDKVAIITGASEGIGKQVALKLAEEGVNLALIARSQDKLAKVAKLAQQFGGKNAIAYRCDIRDSRQLKSCVNKIIADFKGVNMLINNAGIWQKLNVLEDVPEETVEDVIMTNLTAHIQITRLLLPYLKKQKDAAIINISSRSGVKAQELQSVYSASKYGVHGFTEVLKEELKKTNVRVAGVYQGGVDTRMFEKAGDVFDQSHFINPQDLADVVVYMLSRPPKIWIHDVRLEY